MITVFFLRHAECISMVSEEKGLILDDENVITSDGRLAIMSLAAELGKTEAGKSIRLYSSNIIRAKETVAVLSSLFGVVPNYSDLLGERFFNFPLDISPYEARELQVSAYRSPYENVLAGESVAEHYERVQNWFRWFCEQIKEKDTTHIVVTHGGVINLLVLIIFGSPVNTVSSVYTACDPGHFHCFEVEINSDGQLLWKLCLTNRTLIGMEKEVLNLSSRVENYSREELKIKLEAALKNLQTTQGIVVLAKFVLKILELRDPKGLIKIFQSFSLWPE